MTLTVKKPFCNLNLFLLLLAVNFTQVHAQTVGNVTGVSLITNGISLQCDKDIVVFQVCKENVIKVNLLPNGIENNDTLVIGNTTWDPVAVSIDTTTNPIRLQTSKFKIEISRSPMRFSVYDSTGQLLCNEPASGGINGGGIYLTTTGGNFYGLHNRKSGGLKLTTGGNIYAGSQGDAGAPFVWTTKGWGVLADVESGRLEYTTNSVNFFRGASTGSTIVSYSPRYPTKNDTITISVTSTKTAKLHWGVNYSGHTWIKPDSSYWPASSTLYSDKVAVETPFSAIASGQIKIKVGPFDKTAQAVSGLAFVVHYDDNTWDNNSGNDYQIDFTTQSDTIPVKKDIEFYFVFGNPTEIFTGMTDVTGKPPLFPKYSLGFMNSQWGIDQTELLSIVGTYRAKGIPIDAYILDFDWMDWGADNYGEFRFGPKFPSATSGALKDTLLKNGVKLFGIRKPRIHTGTVEGAYGQANNFFVKYTTDYFSGKQVGLLNFNKPEVRDWYWNSYVNQANSYNLGMVGYWNDEADEYGDSFNFMQMQRSEYEGQRKYNDKRVWSINRNYYLGAQRYAYGHWSGDINTGFSSMAEQAPYMLSSVVLGSGWWGMDIGGFNGNTPTDDNYYRWMEFGAFVPIYRVHGTNGQKRYPWFFSAEAEQIATSYIKTRYKLLPYIYTAAWQNHLTGLSIVRPFPVAFPTDNSGSDMTDEWMFGDNMLVKPVLTQNATSVSVYLPQGTWIDYWNGKSYTGTSTINYAVTNATIPVFVKAGSVIPTAPVGSYVNDSVAQKLLILSCYAGANGKGFVYEDDGETYQYEKGMYAITAFSQTESNRYTDLNINARSGIFTPPVRDYLAEFNFAKIKPDSVWINSVPVIKTTATAILASSVTAWAYDSVNYKAYVRLKDNAAGNTIRLFRTNLVGIEKENLPVTYALAQNYPNPFNPTTTIRYQIPNGGQVVLKVYNTLGKEVMTLVNEYKGAGEYNVGFNGVGLASGMYFYQIKVNNYSSTKKMMLIK